MSQSNRRFAFLAGAILISAGLYFSLSGDKSAKEGETVKVEETAGFSFEMLNEEAKKSLSQENLKAINEAEGKLKESNSAGALNNLGKLWDENRIPAVAAHYYEQAAEKQPTEKAWIDAAYRYFDGYQATGDSVMRKMMIGKAISNYEKAAKLNPENLDVKSDLGICYAQEGSNPMKGIMLLREVVAKNPDHEMAQYNLGILSVQSGQLEKAVERFEKVVQLNPKRAEARFLLARTYADLGRKEEALKNFRIVKEEVKDPQLNAEIDNIIKQIK